jgi:membrane protease YdiL (CAAX protease family)
LNFTGVKQCSSCGLTSSAIALYCQSCGTAFPALVVDASAPPAPVSLGQTETKPLAAPYDRKLRIFELFLVCFIAFGGSLIASTYHWFSGLPRSGNLESYRWWYGMSQEAGALILLWYVMQRHSERFSHLGLRWNWLDVALTPALWAACYAAYYLSYAIIGIYFSPFLDSRMHSQVSTFLFSGGVTAGMILFAVLNPFFEELIVRAFLITQLRKVGCNIGIAVAASVLVQVSYHFYQGTWIALSHVGDFLILSLYYAKTNRILAPILVHMIFDLWPTLYYLVRPTH